MAHYFCTLDATTLPPSLENKVFVPGDDALAPPSTLLRTKSFLSDIGMMNEIVKQTSSVMNKT